MTSCNGFTCRALAAFCVSFAALPTSARPQSIPRARGEFLLFAGQIGKLDLARYGKETRPILGIAAPLTLLPDLVFEPSLFFIEKLDSQLGGTSTSGWVRFDVAYLTAGSQYYRNRLLPYVIGGIGMEGDLTSASLGAGLKVYFAGSFDREECAVGPVAGLRLEGRLQKTSIKGAQLPYIVSLGFSVSPPSHGRPGKDC